MTRTLVIAEHDQGQVKLATFAAAGFARRLQAASGSYEILVLGEHVGPVAEALRHTGAENVLVADHASLRHPLADRYAQVIAEVVRQRNATVVVAAASTFSKDILPRAAALLDAGMLSDVVEVQSENGELTFKRVMFAGNVIATVQLEGTPKFVTVRAAAFAAPAKTESASPVVPFPFDPAGLPALAEFLGRDQKAAARPDATEARVVVSGGRALKNAEDFERLVGGLADTLGAAVGSSRALVDSGITPNSLQIGQTGKIVAPEVYIAVGISGAIQHLAGMKDTKVVVAINKDPEAPIFEVADYGLVADVYDAVPQLIHLLKKG
ncbi:MAG TPA: FAD-binding protein [Candidatus Saccharimonadales bacterium]|nr:FAD-binding protein [Candidatus Saccharimonadales bacterium]